MHNIHVIAALTLPLGFILGRLLHKLGLTEVLAYLLAGIIIGPILNSGVSGQFRTLVTRITLAFTAYAVGSTFFSRFSQENVEKMLTILIAEVLTTPLVPRFSRRLI